MNLKNTLIKGRNKQIFNICKSHCHILDTNNSAFLVSEEDLEHEQKLVKMIWETVLIEELYHHMISPVVLHIVLQNYLPPCYHSELPQYILLPHYLSLTVYFLQLNWIWSMEGSDMEEKFQLTLQLVQHAIVFTIIIYFID